MRRQLLNAFMLLAIVTVAAGAAQAQTPRRVVVQVPFDFVVGKRTLPAGTYTVKQWTSDKLLLVQSADGRTAQSVWTNPLPKSTEAAAARLDFRRYGDKYFLAQVWTAGEATGRALVPSPLERAFTREVARGTAQGQAAEPQVVSVKGHLE